MEKFLEQIFELFCEGTSERISEEFVEEFEGKSSY